MAKKPETVFRERVRKFLPTLKNTSYFPIQQMTIRGDADFILCVCGHFVWLELKKDEKSKPTALQIYKAEWVRKTGGITLLAYPENWEHVKETLSMLDKMGAPYR